MWIISSHRLTRKQFWISTVHPHATIGTYSYPHTREDSVTFNLKNSIISCFPGGKYFLETSLCGVYDVWLYHPVLRKKYNHLSCKQLLLWLGSPSKRQAECAQSPYLIIEIAVISKINRNVCATVCPLTWGLADTTSWRKEARVPIRCIWVGGGGAEWRSQGNSKNNVHAC